MKTISAFVLALGVVLSLLTAQVAAQGVFEVCPEGVSSSSAICSDTSQATDIVKNIVNLFLFAIGAVSVVMIIHSGLKYVTSRGDAEQVKSAKNTLLYAVVGVIVAMLSFAIVNFVVGAFNGGTQTEGTSELSEAPEET